MDEDGLQDARLLVQYCVQYFVVACGATFSNYIVVAEMHPCREVTEAGNTLNLKLIEHAIH